jgi:hypothetical protein
MNTWFAFGSLIIHNMGITQDYAKVFINVTWNSTSIRASLIRHHYNTTHATVMNDQSGGLHWVVQHTLINAQQIAMTRAIMIISDLNPLCLWN